MRSRSSNNLGSQARLEQFARQHRSRLTPSEARLWTALKSRQLGVSFCRQVPVGGHFINDFVAPAIGLIVEIDGGYHGRQASADGRRDRKLCRLGYRVVRINSELVLRDLAAAIAVVRAAF